MSNQNNEILFVDCHNTARNLYGMRVQLNCTQEEFGRKVGIDQASMSAYELEKRTPSKRTVRKIAEWFGIDPRMITGQIPMAWSEL